MKLSEFKQLIKQSILEEKEKEKNASGAMTPEEEKMVADYEEEEANKHALDNERPLEEALNKDIKAFGQDLDKAFKAAGFDTLVLMRGPSAEQMNIVKTNPKAVLFLVTETRGTQTLAVYVNPKQIQKAESIINKFQLSDFDGPVLTRGWTAKQVKGAINPGDIVKQDDDKDKGTWYFYRLAQVDTKVKSMEEAMVSPDNRVAYLVDALDHVWNMGKGNNTVDFESLAQSLVKDMFDEEPMQEDVIAEAERIITEWNSKKQLTEAFDQMDAMYQDLDQVVKNIAHIAEVGKEEAAMLAIEFIAEQYQVSVDFKDFM